jgi:hypothetical protein
MADLYTELCSRWQDLIDDPLGPTHYCKSLFTFEIIPVTYTTATVHDVYPYGSLLVGMVIRTERATIDLFIGQQLVCTLKLFKNRPCLALGSKNVVPLVALQSTPTSLLPATPLTMDLIYAHLDDSIRRELVSGSWSLAFRGWWLHVSRGVGLVDNGAARHTILPEIPSTTTSERHRERLDVIEEELVAAAWHPGRFRQWCLDMTDELVTLARNDSI